MPLAPMLMFAILFGLSMDYEVFLLSRVREQFMRHGDAKKAIVEGVATTGRVITSAALIMISVFASFILMADVTAKMFGVGLAVAVLLDVTLVRMVLVPSAMSLLGARAWWLPKWLDRLLPEHRPGRWARRDEAHRRGREAAGGGHQGPRLRIISYTAGAAGPSWGRPRWRAWGRPTAPGVRPATSRDPARIAVRSRHEPAPHPRPPHRHRRRRRHRRPRRRAAPRQRPAPPSPCREGRVLGTCRRRHPAAAQRPRRAGRPRASARSSNARVRPRPHLASPR